MIQDPNAVGLGGCYDVMSYGLNSLKGAYIEDYRREYYRGYSGRYQEFRV